MLRSIWRSMTRMTTQPYKSSFRQLRHLHEDGSKLPKSKNETISETISETGEYGQSAPVNIDHFKALVEPPNAVYRKRYRLRWDWHLRNFLMALMPPGALLIVLKLVEWRFSEDMNEFEHLFPTAQNPKKKLEDSVLDSNTDEDRAEGGAEGTSLKASLNEMLLRRMENLENEMANLRAQLSKTDPHLLNQESSDKDDGLQALMRAKNICRTIARQKRDLG